jgi:hypothetical protein
MWKFQYYILFKETQNQENVYSKKTLLLAQMFHYNYQQRSSTKLILSSR